MHDIVQQLTEFIRDHADWAAPIVFALAFMESLAFMPLLVRAWGALVKTGGISFWPIWIAGSLGAATGDWLSWWVGLKLEYRVAHMWPLSRHPDLIPAAKLS